MSPSKLSVITCFHNSAARLPPYFAALNRLKLPQGGVEFVLVDNASTDTTRSLLEKAAGKLPAPSKVLAEPKPGLMHARLTGISAASGDVALFLDDDNEPEFDYLVELERLLSQHPSAVLFTGNCVLPDDYPIAPREADVFPLLVLRELRGEYAFQLDSLVPPNIPWGAGLCGARTDILNACRSWAAGDGTIVGRKGDELSGGEDIWLAHYLTATGRPVVFSDRLRLRHRIDVKRFEAPYLAKLSLSNGMEHVAITTAALALKPQLSAPAPGILRLLRVGLLVIPIRIALFALSRNLKSMTDVASQLGYAYSLLRHLMGTR
jgi:glycosyltransferase involved in cell wall biosynthesis